MTRSLGASAEVPVVHEEETPEAARERWLKAQVAKAPAWTPERVARLAEALGYDAHTMSTESTGNGR